MKEVEIKDISGKVRFSTPINKGAKGKFTLMKEDYIILPFSVAKPVAFKMGDYVDLSEVLDESLGGKLSKIYEIVDLQKPTYNSSTGGYDYELKLDAYYWKWKNKIFKYTPENAGSEASWTLTAGLDVQLGVFLRNLKALGYTYKGKDYVFEIDSTVENKAIAMTYDNINLLDALFSMAGEDKWNCDCWVEENVIHFGRNEFGDAVKIERDIEASSITRSESQGIYATRIYAFGGTRNIPCNYGKKFIDTVSFIQGDVRFTGLQHNTNYYLQQGADAQIRFLTGAEKDNTFSVRWNSGHFYFQDDEVCNASIGDRFELLNYPENVPDRYLSYGTEDLVVNGVVQKRLMMPADTPYIDVYPDMSQEEAVESIVVFDDIYPKRVGTMSDVNTVSRDIKEDDKVVGTFDAYQYKDAGLVFDKKYQIEGTELKITFQSGKMNGMEFGVIFDPNDKNEQLWEIVRNEDYGRPLPDEYIHPENGDQYVLSGFNIKLVSDQYISSAEQELKERAQKYADKTKIDDGTYPVTLRSDWVKESLILRTFGFGQRINLIDDTFFENGRISRVLGWEMNLDIPWDSPVYTIGESMPYSRIGELEEKVDSLIYNGQTYNGNYGGGGSYVYVIKTNDSTSPTDNNVFSALRSLATFLRKDKEDSTKYLLTLLAGAVFGANKAEITAEGVAQVVSLLVGSKAEITAEGKAILQNLLVKVQAEINRLLVTGGAEVQNGLLADLITVQNGLLKTIITPTEIRTATAIATNVQTEVINNDGDSAVLHGNKADFKGPVGSKSYAPGLTGFGWNVDAKGNAWFNGINLREFLEVPELRYNRITVITDEQWSAPGGGIIESADMETLILTLKLEEGEAAALEVDDICKGIFHSGTGFSTCFFRITEVLGESTFRYTLRPGYEMHPMTAMHFVAYGNFTNPNRQKSAYTTREYTRYLKDVNDWDITERNIVMMMGNLEGMHLNGMDMSGYSAFLRNIYMTGTIKQISSDGVTETPVPAWKGEWVPGTYYKNDEVTHNGSTWLCISDEPTTQEPSITATDWLQTVSEGKDAVVVSVYSTNGLFFQNGQGETELYAVVRQGDADITSSLPTGRFSWKRTSRNTEADALWNKTHQGVGPSIHITPEDVEGRSNFDCYVTI